MKPDMYCSKIPQTKLNQAKQTIATYISWLFANMRRLFLCVFAPGHFVMYCAKQLFKMINGSKYYELDNQVTDMSKQCLKLVYCKMLGVIYK